jgi:drug/metabolite transporter (DMT)-like permease
VSQPAPSTHGPGWKAHAALLVVQIAFASQAVEGKIAMAPLAAGGEAVDPPALAMARMIGGAAFFVAFSTAFRLRTPLSRGDLARLAGLSVLGIALNQTLFLVGLRSTTPVSAALLSLTIPVFTAALAVGFRVERPSVRLGVGLGVAVCGVLWLTGIRTIDRGAVLVTVNSLCYALYLVLSRGLLRRLGAFTVITWVFVWGALIFAPVGLPALVRAVPVWTPRAWAFVAWIVAMPTIVAYLANAWALARSTPTLVTIYIFLQPLLAAALAWVQMGTPPSERTLVSGLLILIGVALVATRPPVTSSRA